MSRLMARGMSQREIQVRLAMPGEDGRLVTANPTTGKPWSLGTVNNDCKAITLEWKERAQANISDLKASINAELSELKREGWRANDPKTVLAAIAQQRAMLGLDAPKTIQGTGQDGAHVIILAGNIDKEKL